MKRAPMGWHGKRYIIMGRAALLTLALVGAVAHFQLRSLAAANQKLAAELAEWKARGLRELGACKSELGQCERESEHSLGQCKRECEHDLGQCKQAGIKTKREQESKLAEAGRAFAEMQPPPAGGPCGSISATARVVLQNGDAVQHDQLNAVGVCEVGSFCSGGRCTQACRLEEAERGPDERCKCRFSDECYSRHCDNGLCRPQSPAEVREKCKDSGDCFSGHCDDGHCRHLPPRRAAPKYGERIPPTCAAPQAAAALLRVSTLGAQ